MSHVQNLISVAETARSGKRKLNNPGVCDDTYIGTVTAVNG